MHTNRLIHEKSPYLQQHAHNPVDWRPWGEDAFRAAREQDKPVFLSIGYSTCHWCHVMERESFENEAIAGLLNSSFIPVKLDREERPDVDRLYMTFVQATTGSGGWPLSVWLTPGLQPFFGGTYFPPEARFGRRGFAQILDQIARAWQTQREKVMDSGSRIVAELEGYTAVEPDAEALAPDSIDACFRAFQAEFDVRHGGFGPAPKFPRPSALQFLFRYHHRTGNEEARRMAFSTLDAMSRGGMYDHLGGGFHRYSVDEEWFVPHFEKMLYDQAQLAAVYVEAFQLGGGAVYERTARETLDYVLRDMTHPDGGFYSAEDADSLEPGGSGSKGEGAFYTWTWSELESLLGAGRARRFAAAYGCEPGGNAGGDPHGEFAGKNILWHPRLIGPDDGELAASRQILFDARSRRPRPHLDDKILTAWNGLMISALARAGAAFGEPRYLDAASRAFHFIEARLAEPGSGRLYRRWRDGEAAIPALLDDYAAFALAALDLHLAVFNGRLPEAAARACLAMIEIFEDEPNGGFFSASGSTPDLLFRMKEDYDGAEPSGNSLAIEALHRLSALTGDNRFDAAARRALAAFASRLHRQPAALPRMFCSWMLRLAPPARVEFSGDAQELVSEFHRHFLPFTTAIWNERSGARSVVVCRDLACQPAVNTVAALRELLH